MKDSIQNYDGLYGEQHPRILPDFVQVERIEKRSHHYKWVIKPHMHANLFQLFFVEDGHGTITSDRSELPFTGPCLLLIPQHSLHGFRYFTETSGTVLTISSLFIDALTGQYPIPDSQLTHNQIVDLTKQPRWHVYLNGLLDRLSDEVMDALPGRSWVLQSLLTALLTDVFRYVWQQNSVETMAKNRASTIFLTFQKAIRHGRNPQKNIGQYAQEQHITAVHLNRVCREVMHKSAMQIVHDYFIAEACNYLIHTQYTIAEIAYRLNYEDAAYFSRLFKKQTGLTPRAYRRNGPIHPHATGA